MAARNNYGPHYVVWTDAELATMRAAYATSGGAVLSRTLLPTRSPGKIRDKASKMGLYYVPQGPKPRNREPRPKKAPAPKPAKVVAKPAKVPRPVAVKRSAKTPNLNRQKSQVAARKAPAAPITADAIRKMRYDDPQRLAYMLNGVAGWQAYMQGITA